MNDMIPNDAPTFARQVSPVSVNAGAVAVEQERAIAEAQGQLILAKRFPRDLNAAYAELMESCKHPAMAAAAFYSVPRAGGSVTGPSIRLAEELARVCGNIEYGHRELSRDAGKSEVEVYAWDKQTNTRRIRQVTVAHTIDTKNGPKPCRDQKDVDDLIANKASKQMRSLVLSLMPVWLKEAAIEECRKTLAGNNGIPLSERIRRMTQAFAPFGVTVKHLETYLGHALDMTTADELVDLTGIHNAIKTEGRKPSEYFGAETTEQAEQKVTAADIAKQAEDAKPEPTREPAATTEPPKPTTEAPQPEPDDLAEALDQIAADMGAATTMDDLGTIYERNAATITAAQKAKHAGFKKIGDAYNAAEKRIKGGK